MIKRRVKVKFFQEGRIIVSSEGCPLNKKIKGRQKTACMSGYTDGKKVTVSKKCSFYKKDSIRKEKNLSYIDCSDGGCFDKNETGFNKKSG